MKNSSLTADRRPAEDRLVLLGGLFCLLRLNPAEAQPVETNQQLRRILLATAMTSIRIGVLPAANAPVPSIEPPAQRSVNVYLENIPDVFWNSEEAKTITSQIFSAIGVKLIWVYFHDERTASQDGTIIVRFSAETPIYFQPRALALSFPFEGVHARAFYDRVRQRVRPPLVSALLAHVFAHEITHLLERTGAHSDSGIMKTCWDPSDYDQMARGPLTFTDSDVRLIYAGLDARPKSRPNALANYANPHNYDPHFN